MQGYDINNSASVLDYVERLPILRNPLMKFCFSGLMKNDQKSQGTGPMNETWQDAGKVKGIKKQGVASPMAIEISSVL